MTITYRLNGNIYINLTNRCSNSCDFCLRNNGDFCDYDLWLKEEPTAGEVIRELGDMEGAGEIVFCGYGEPLYRLDAIIEICDYAHSKGKKTRLNTNGQAKFIVGGGVPQKLHGKVDTVSISLNATSAEKYQEICHSEFGKEAYEALLEFGRECVKYIPKVVFTVVDNIGEKEIEKAKEIVKGIGAEIRVRKYLS